MKIFEIIEEIIRCDEEGMEVQAQDLALPVYVRVKDDLPRVLATYPIITSDKPPILNTQKDSENVNGNNFRIQSLI